MSLVLADRARRRRRRASGVTSPTIAGCALLVSAGSYAMFPKTYIWFGVLHAIAISLIAGASAARGGRRWRAAIGGVVIAAGRCVQHPAFDNRALGWIGFMTAKPYTEDYVPLFPWAGVVFVGIALGHFAGAPGLCADRAARPARRDGSPRSAGTRC